MILPSFPNGPMMVPALVKLLEQIVKCCYSKLPSPFPSLHTFLHTFKSWIILWSIWTITYLGFVLFQHFSLMLCLLTKHNSPQAIFKDPFRRGENILVMCDTYTAAGEPIPTNKRYNAAKIFSHPDVVAEEPWYGIEQEYTLLQKDVQWPLGWPIGGFPGPQVSKFLTQFKLESFFVADKLSIGPYYCGVGANKAFGRDIVNSHFKACLYAGINITGINGEVMPGQWEFQIGPSAGISACDDLWVARYILERITEIAGVVLSFDPQPIKGDWNCAGAHTNFSTKSMRSDGGYEVIKKAISKLEKRHKEHIAAYGEGNERRLTGKHETADINTFIWGVANRGASIRVGRDTEKKGKGYFEDRRPASNMDPYVVTSMIAQTIILWKP
ncbi:hypothetical protein VIGAN_03095700 [Vigna angularis var. angularis]|uniref:glutamine synthetase n=1 Tax=Vigna angularis var. angularis TaxID=157739 RepID=A0A0S3RL15_PHAAN|nr:hypothetical protein VIGAN_03095700 [Vigna angularis var. angularis]